MVAETGRSAAQPLDMNTNGLERGIGVEVGGVQNPGIRCGTQGCHRPFLVAAVAKAQLFQNGRVYNG
jgi:hypothetical protein